MDPVQTSVIATLKQFFKNYVQNKPEIELALMYGSFAHGKARADSDIDIALLFSQEINDFNKYAVIMEITLKLNKLLAREVNIISLDWDFKHPMLFFNAIVAGVPLFVADSKKYLNYKLEAIFQMEDFQIFGVRWQELVAGKILGGLKHA